jgi:Cys-rich repeat protein
MHQRLLLPLICCVVGFASSAQAQVVIDKTQAVAGPRRDVGTGACGTFIQYKRQGMPPMPPRTKQDAIDLLNKPGTDPALRGRISRLIDRINFRNGDGYTGFVEGDFTGAMSADEYLPYSQSAKASPTGDDLDIAMRVRGYFNVPADMAGKTVTFGMNCDDFCALRIGKTDVVPGFDITQSSRVIRQAKFTDSGLYPIEMIYFQTAGPAYIEWALADTPQPECSQGCNLALTDTAYNGQFKLIPSGRLFSAIIGENRPCQECGAPGLDCSPGNYCGDGLCQDCNVPDHCGPTCMRCPDDRRICSAGACVQCTLDEQCPSGRVCVNGTCTPPTRCNRNEQCPAGQVCDPTTNTCKMPPPPCTTDAMCPAGTVCNGTFCEAPKTPCTTDANCASGQYCDNAVGYCKPRLDSGYYGAYYGCSFGQNTTQKSSGAGWLALGGLMLGGLFLSSRRRKVTASATGAYTGSRRSGAFRLLSRLLPVFFCALATDAFAQSGAISLNAQTFRPAIGPENIIQVEGTRTPGKWVPMANVWIEYARRPLALYNNQTKMLLAETVPDMLTLHLSGGIGLTKWLAIGVDLPVVVYQGFDRNTPQADVPLDPATAGLGDLRLVGKMRIIDNTEGGFGLAFVPQISFPTGKGEEFRGDGDASFGFEPRLALDYRTKKGFIVAVNASVFLRTQDQEARNIRVSHQVRYGIGAYIPLPKNFGLAGELVGGTSFFNNQDIYSPLELDVAARWVHRTGITVNLGGGPGLTPVAGVPQYRLFASVGYLPLARKKEEIKTRVVDLDPDRDGLIGENDRCPTQYGPPENQGCPDVDTDKDGLVDRLDKCPLEPGPKENQGCPDKDRDGDGLVDRLDSCPDEPGPLENNGCPLLDTDKDTIPDKDDKCPFEPGPKETQGCPPPKKYIMVEKDEIKLLQQILFATNKWDIKPASFPLLDEVVSVMKSRPTMRVHIEGHTDSRGTLKWNMQLSKNRAESVRKYLTDHGVDGERLTSDGYGPTRPLCPEKTAACYDRNRRTQFIVVQQ